MTEHDTYGAPPVGALTDETAIEKARMEGIQAAYDAGMESLSAGHGVFYGITQLLKAKMKQGVEPMQADPLSELARTPVRLEGSILHDWRTSDKLGGEICAACSAMKGTRRGNLSCASPTPAPSEAVKGVSTAEPAGWKLVPIELTEEMHAAAVRTIIRCTGNGDFPPRVYRAMLAAAPSHPPATEPAVAVQAEPIDLDRVLNLADLHAEESREDGFRVLDRGGLEAFAKDCVRIFGAAHPKPAAPLPLELSADDIRAIRNSVEGPKGYTEGVIRKAFEWGVETARSQPAAPATAFQQALEIRIAAGWKLEGNACPILYTDEINGQQVCRDDLWITTTAGLKAAPATADEAVSERTRKLVEGLAEQQAMPDDWWKPELAAILAVRSGAS